MEGRTVGLPETQTKTRKDEDLSEDLGNDGKDGGSMGWMVMGGRNGEEEKKRLTRGGVGGRG
jgi:hypothetical protein